MPDATTNYELVVAALRDDEGVLRGVLRPLVHPDDVDDAFQVAAMRAVERAASLRDPARVLPWLRRLFRNVAIDSLRRRASQPSIVDDTVDLPDRRQDDAEWCGCSVSQIEGLAANYATVLGLVDIDGVQLRDAARSLGITVNNATVRLHRARKALKKRMLEHCGVTSPRDCLDCRCVYEGCCGAG